MTELNEHFWTERYQKDQTGWDIGDVSTPLKEYIDQISDTSMEILIPGAGNAYEAEYLWKKGFRCVDVLDVSEEPLSHLKMRLPEWPEDRLIHGDFFDHDKKYDLIIEQTFFCALSPNLREAYVNKMSELLKPTGKLVGLLFNVPLNIDQPPFGGNARAYRALFEEKLRINKMEKAYNSIPQRAGNELWISLSHHSKP